MQQTTHLTRFFLPSLIHFIIFLIHPFIVGFHVKNPICHQLQNHSNCMIPYVVTGSNSTNYTATHMPCLVRQGRLRNDFRWKIKIRMKGSKGDAGVIWVWKEVPMNEKLIPFLHGHTDIIILWWSCHWCVQNVRCFLLGFCISVMGLDKRQQVCLDPKNISIPTTVPWCRFMISLRRAWMFLSTSGRIKTAGMVMHLLAMRFFSMVMNISTLRSIRLGDWKSKRLHPCSLLNL